MSFNFELLNYESLKENDSFIDFSYKSIFTTVEWLAFIERDQKHLTPIVLQILKGERLIGYFCSFLFKKAGLKIIGSPFRGWSTCYMGFNLNPEIDVFSVLPFLKDFLFNNFSCHFIEIVDSAISLDRAIIHDYYARPEGTLLLDIDKTDQELFKIFKVDCRNYIRQFEKKGAVCEISSSSDSFVEDYYSQLMDVFAKQNMLPTYTLEKVRLLVSTIAPSNILCLRVFTPDHSLCIASSIFLGYNGIFYFWGCASLREYQKYRPNEYMIWTAIQYWRNKGYKLFDMVGIRDYKKKFGSHESSYTRIIIPKYKALIYIRDCAEKLYFFKLNIEYKAKNILCYFLKTKSY